MNEKVFKATPFKKLVCSQRYLVLLQATQFVLQA